MWRSPIFWRIFGTLSLLLIVSIGLLGWFLLVRMEKHALADIEKDLEQKAILVRETVAGRYATKDGLQDQPRDEAGNKESLQQLVRRLGHETQSRVTVIQPDGTVIAESDRDDLQNIDNHLSRPEVVEAATRGWGTSTRHSDTVDQDMMYVALRVESGNRPWFVRMALPLGEVQSEINWLRGGVWTGAGITLVVALLVSLWLARRLSRPLIELADAARAMGQGGCAQRVAIDSKDEIGTLAAAFNDMSEACAAHITQMDQDRQRLRAILSSMVEGVIMIDADQRVLFLNEAASRLLPFTGESPVGKKLWQVVRHLQLDETVERILAGDKPLQCQLEWTSPEPRVLSVHGTCLPGGPTRGAVLVFHDVTSLRRLERHRQDFVANVSHELKTPLAAIQATVETLLDGALDDPEHNTRFLQRIGENADRLHRLVQDLLTLGHIESGQEVLEIQPLAVESAVAGCLARHEHRATTKGLRLEPEPPPEPLLARADEEALAHVLDNLVDNALKYTPEGGRVALRWFADGDDVVLEVRDTGIGIPDKDLPRIFERFYRVDKARSRALGGTGLGLAIVKHLVQALGGSITAGSKVGEGTTFTVRLPRETSAAPTAV